MAAADMIIFALSAKLYLLASITGTIFQGIFSKVEHRLLRVTVATDHCDESGVAFIGVHGCTFHQDVQNLKIGVDDMRNMHLLVMVLHCRIFSPSLASRSTTTSHQCRGNLTCDHPGWPLWRRYADSGGTDASRVHSRCFCTACRTSHMRPKTF